MRITVTRDHLGQLLLNDVLLDQRTHGYKHEISGAIWIEHRTDLHNNANWELLPVPAFIKLPADCQAAMLDAVSDLQSRYSLQSNHFLGGSAKA